MKKRCFSLVELVVVVVLLAAVAVILLLWLGSAAKRRKAQQMTCLYGNLKELSMSLSLYGDDNRSYLPDGDNAAGLSTLLRLNYLKNSKTLVCPATKDIPAADWRELAKDGEQHCSYLYNGGLYMNDLTPQNVIVRDKAGNHRKVQQTIMGDFSVKQEKD